MRDEEDNWGQQKWRVLNQEIRQLILRQIQRMENEISNIGGEQQESSNQIYNDIQAQSICIRDCCETYLKQYRYPTIIQSLPIQSQYSLCEPQNQLNTSLSISLKCCSQNQQECWNLDLGRSMSQNAQQSSIQDFIVQAVKNQYCLIFSQCYQNQIARNLKMSEQIFELFPIDQIQQNQSNLSEKFEVRKKDKLIIPNIWIQHNTVFVDLVWGEKLYLTVDPYLKFNMGNEFGIFLAISCEKEELGIGRNDGKCQKKGKGRNGGSPVGSIKIEKIDKNYYKKVMESIQIIVGAFLWMGESGQIKISSQEPSFQEIVPYLL